MGSNLKLSFLTALLVHGVAASGFFLMGDYRPLHGDSVAEVPMELISLPNESTASEIPKPVEQPRLEAQTRPAEQVRPVTFKPPESQPVPVVEQTSSITPIVQPPAILVENVAAPSSSTSSTQTAYAGSEIAGVESAGGAEPNGEEGESSGVGYGRTFLPKYPKRARNQKQEGLVILLVEVSDCGLPSLVRIKESSGFELLDKAAQHAVGQWTFVPARARGFAVASRVEVPVRFTLAN